MKNIFEQLVPKDQNWLDGSFKHSQEMLNSFEILRLLLQRKNLIGHRRFSDGSFKFLLENIQVNFVDPKKFPTRTLSLGFASQTLTINIPDKKLWNQKHREDIREEIQMKYGSILQESHIRTMVLLWKLIAPAERKSLQSKLKKQMRVEKKAGGLR
jgi:hypothetical protein